MKCFNSYTVVMSALHYSSNPQNLKEKKTQKPNKIEKSCETNLGLLHQNFAGDSGEPGLSQVVFQVFSWRLSYYSIKLCCPGRHFILQAPFLPAFQGEGELQPSY